MSVTDSLRGMAADLLGDWRLLRVGDLQFWHRDDARLLLVSLAMAAGLVLVARFAMPRRRGRYTVAVPAILSSISRPASAHFTHLPLIVALAGLPFLAVAARRPVYVAGALRGDLSRAVVSA